MLHGLPNSSAWCVVPSLFSQVNVIRCESYFIGLCVCNFGELLSHIKPKSSLLSKSAKENSIMPQEFLLEPSRTQIWEGSNMWKQFLDVFGIMPSRCFQDESRCFGSKHVVVFWLYLRHARLRSSRDPWEGGGLVSKKAIHWMIFASCFFLACFGCIFL